MKREVKSQGLSDPAGAFSHAIEVPLPGSLLFASGMTARARDGSVVGAGDITKQTEVCLENLATILAEKEMTLDDVVAVTVYVRDMRHFEAIHAVRRRYFDPPFPSSTIVEVSQLALPEMLIEITAVASRHEV